MKAQVLRCFQIIHAESAMRELVRFRRLAVDVWVAAVHQSNKPVVPSSGTMVRRH